MSLALDSSAFIDVLRGRKPKVTANFEAARAAELHVCISAVVWHELTYGALLSERPERNLRLLETMAASLQIDAWDREDALAAAKVRVALEAAGTPIGFLDTLIAGHALARDHTLVTGNSRHFERVRGLRLIDWSLSAEPD